MSWGDVLLIAGGLGAGFLSGTIGIGGGLLFVPTMTVGFRISQAVAQGTSLVAIVPTAIAQRWFTPRLTPELKEEVLAREEESM